MTREKRLWIVDDGLEGISKPYLRVCYPEINITYFESAQEAYQENRSPCVGIIDLSSIGGTPGCSGHGIYLSFFEKFIDKFSNTPFGIMSAIPKAVEWVIDDLGEDNLLQPCVVFPDYIYDHWPTWLAWTTYWLYTMDELHEKALKDYEKEKSYNW